jgi:hypothetical protein
MLVGDSFTVREATAVQIHAFVATPARPDAARQCVAFDNPCNLQTALPRDQGRSLLATAATPRTRRPEGLLLWESLTIWAVAVAVAASQAWRRGDGSAGCRGRWRCCRCGWCRLSCCSRLWRKCRRPCNRPVRRCRAQRTLSLRAPPAASRLPAVPSLLLIAPSWAVVSRVVPCRFPSPRWLAPSSNFADMNKGTTAPKAFLANLQNQANPAGAAMPRPPTPSAWPPWGPRAGRRVRRELPESTGLAPLAGAVSVTHA